MVHFPHQFFGLALTIQRIATDADATGGVDTIKTDLGAASNNIVLGGAEGDTIWASASVASDGTWVVTGGDDGKGHSPADGCGTQPLPSGSGPHSSGLRGMSERLSAVGGTLEVRPDLHPGFSLTATVPSRAPQPAPAPAPGMTSSTA